MGSGKINLLLNLVKYQGPDIDKKLFVLQRSIEIKVWTNYQLKRKTMDKEI